MKIFLTVVTVLFGSFYSTHADLPKKDSFMDLLGASEKVPVVFAAQEVLFNPYVSMLKPDRSTYDVSTCDFVETIPVTKAYDGMAQDFVDQLNAAFDTDKFYLYDGELKEGKRKGMGMLGALTAGSAEVADRVVPNINKYQYKEIGQPLMVIATLGASYQSDAVLANDLMPSKLKEYLAAGGSEDNFKSSVSPVMTLTGFLNARFVTYDKKKDRAKMVSLFSMINAGHTHSETFSVSRCNTAISEFTIMQHPDKVVDPLKAEIEDQIKGFVVLMKKK